MRIKFSPTLVCFQEVPQLATEEVSIFRQMGPADRLSSLVDRHLGSGSKSLRVFLHKREPIIHARLGICAYSCMLVYIYLC